jgi:hypothetical protein
MELKVIVIAVINIFKAVVLYESNNKVIGKFNSFLMK